MNAVYASLLAASLFAADPAAKPSASEKLGDRSAAGAAAYEQLATAIIATRAAEDSLVAEILGGYYEAAYDHLEEAIADTAHTAAHLEAAATEVTNIANEGDKQVQAIRQRLAKAGHTHNSDADTKEDFMFVSSAEKKSLLALAKKIAQLGAKAKPADVKAAQKELTDLFDKSMAR